MKESEKLSNSDNDNKEEVIDEYSNNDSDINSKLEKTFYSDKILSQTNDSNSNNSEIEVIEDKSKLKYNFFLFK